MTVLSSFRLRQSHFWLWLALLAGTASAWLYPVGYRLLRIVLVVATLTVWVWGLCLLRRHKRVALSLAGACALAFAFCCLPGRSVDVAALRQAYVRALLAYEGTPYVWGGENRFGIDCSGLVRKGLINANVCVGLRTLNPRLVRQALYLWWNDCSAQALRDEYRGLTVRVSEAKRINWVEEEALRPGDLAVTANGVHVLAYVGNQTWVEADPGPWKVIQVKVPAKNPWFLVPVRIVRWAQLQDERDAIKRPPPGPL